ncbi:MAG: hypothetical protein ABIO86_06165 [Sphingomonas sp.]
MKYISAVLALVAPMVASAAIAAAAPAAPKLGRIAAECTVEQDHGNVAALLRTLPGSPEESRAAHRIAEIFAACGAELNISTRSQGLYNGRADLAAAAAARALGRQAPSFPAAPLAPWYKSAIAGRSPGHGYDAVSLGMQEFGTCVVGAVGDASARLIRSAAGSAEEREAIGAIKPVLAGCVVQGQPMHMTLDQLRLLIAEPVYHVVVDGRS